MNAVETSNSPRAVVPKESNTNMVADYETSQALPSAILPFNKTELKSQASSQDQHVGNEPLSATMIEQLKEMDHGTIFLATPKNIDVN